MRIVIDMQGAQTESRFRGIGRYTLSLAQAIVRNRGEHEIILALSGLLPDTIEPIRATFDGQLPQENIRVWYAPGPVREREPGNDWRREVAERIREAFLASLRPDVVHIASLFEGYVDDAVTSIGVFAPQIPTVVTVHNLIPLLNPETYLKPNPVYARHYQRKVEHLKRAYQFLAISESAAGEARDTLAIPAESVIITYEGCDAIFRRMKITEHEKQKLLTRFGITQPFVLYSGGADARKNLHRLIRAYARLPKLLRDAHQLMLVGKMPEGEVAELWQTAKSGGISEGQLLFTGYVTDEELAQFYNLCTVFVFPSLHEGFGLPALEAMSCGAAVIGANTTSIPEVIGRQDALFDPYDKAAISQKLAQVLGDAAFRAELAAHGLEQSRKFSWDASARRAIAAFERLHAKIELPKLPSHASARRAKLAFVSPLPPERTGIADYSAELLPELAKHYDIEVVVAQEHVGDAWVQANCPVRDSQWLRANAHRIDRVLYQLGNSPFHQHMLALLEEVPGTVVLHDFFLSGLLAYLEEHSIVQHAWVRALYHAHGYSAVRERYHASNPSDVKMKYPVNLQVLQRAQGVIVHSEYSSKLASEWYGKDFAADWRVIPHLRTPSAGGDRAQSRATLGLKKDDFVVCSFGFLNPTKLNHRLLDAWLHSLLAQDARCVLVFVGENHGGEYGAHLRETIRASGLAKRIRITGWADMPIFRNYLAAADMAVQLRTLSRGETSGTVLDCMNHALPTIVNTNGSMADLPSDAVWLLPDTFEGSQLVEALETLWQDDERRAALGKRAQELILTRHAPRACAEQYAEAIEQFHVRAQSDHHSLAKAIADLDDHQPTDAECRILAQTIAQSLPAKQPIRQFLLDISATCRTDLKTGIERVARALVMALLDSPPAGYRVEPVYLTNEGGVWHYRYASRYTLGMLECPSDALVDEVVEPRNGDVLLGLDISGQLLIEAEAAGLLTYYRNSGVAIHFMVHDLLPVQIPQFFPPGADANHEKWLQTVARFGRAICVSRTVADELTTWLKTNSLQRKRSFKIGWSHHGADVENSAPTRGLPKNAEQTLAQLSVRPSFLMVGTIEPRKGYLQAIEAFSQLWNEGSDINLVVVGREGWKGLPDEMRRDIPQTIDRLRSHSELNKRLFWLEGISDEYLEKIYAASTCLIAASEGEGFGLPLIEAAQHKLPIIARDIPVFREVTGECAYYFSGKEPSDLALAISEWLNLYTACQHPTSEAMPWLTWKESARQLLIGIGIEPDKGKVWRPIEVAYPDRPVGNATAGGDVALDAGRGRSQEMLSPIRGHWAPPMRIFVDCTHTYTNCMNTGIQRVVRNFVRHTTALGPSLGMLCEPVIFRNGAILPLESLDGPSLHQPRHTLRGYLRRAYLATTHRIAAILPFPPLQRFLLALFFPTRLLAWLRSLVKSDQPSPKGIEGALGKGDILFLPDASWSGDVFGLLARVKAKGGLVVFFVHDIIPLTHPQVCHPVHVERFREWFEQAIRIADFLIYNSLFTQQSITDYLNQRPGTPRPASVVVHLGHDLGPLPTGDIRHGNLRSALAQSPASFLCVGTLEPRKNLGILIDAFEALWNDGHEVSLILIGRAGWLRDKLLARIRYHPELGRRLFWFNDVGDTDLALAYRQASALIFPSIVEGFGLPLVEALSQGLPVIASDIPVFREIAGDHGRFFPPHDAEALASAVKEHLAASSTAGSSTFRWPTWEESSRQLLIALRTFFDGTSDRD